MSAARARSFGTAAVAAATVAIVDQGSKALALANLDERTRVPLIGDVLGLQLAFNPGASFSLGSGSTWLITLITLGCVVVLTRAATRAASTPWSVGLGLIWGGAIGNLLDRLFAPPGFGVGHVTDFLAYGDLFIGNLADVALFAGFATLGVILVRLRAPRTRSAAVVAEREA